MRLNRESALELIEKNISINMVFSKTNLRHVHFAILMKRGKIIAVASNTPGSRSSGCGYDDLSIHAERALLKKIDHRQLSGATMIVIRLSKVKKQLGYSHPCETCMPHMKKCMKNYGMKCIYYS